MLPREDAVQLCSSVSLLPLDPNTISSHDGMAGREFRERAGVGGCSTGEEGSDGPEEPSVWRTGACSTTSGSTGAG